MLVNILDVFACLKEPQAHSDGKHAMFSNEWQSALMLTLEFSNIQYKLYQHCHLNNKYRY